MSTPPLPFHRFLFYKSVNCENFFTRSGGTAFYINGQFEYIICLPGMDRSLGTWIFLQEMSARTLPRGGAPGIQDVTPPEWRGDLVIHWTPDPVFSCLNTRSFFVALPGKSTVRKDYDYQQE
jgi:hypothetical protein